MSKLIEEGAHQINNISIGNCIENWNASVFKASLTYASTNVLNASRLAVGEELGRRVRRGQNFHHLVEVGIGASRIILAAESIHI